MRKLNVVIMFVVLLTFLNGCSGYQLASQAKSVTVDEVSEDTFVVNFCGNAYMSQPEVEKYALQRAAELTLNKGYSHFVVVNKRDDSEVCVLNPKEPYSPPPVPGEKGSASETFPPLLKPNVSLTVKCYSMPDKLPDGAVNAKQFIEENFPGLHLTPNQSR